MSGDSDEFLLGLTLKELISLYLVLSRNESTLDETQRTLFEGVCARVYGVLSVEQVEEIDKYYESL